jgi:hypothetical protein
MSDKSFDVFLAEQLQANTHYLDDDGFTTQLMGCLPAPKRISPWLEKLITWLPVSLITLMVLAQLPLRAFIQPVYAWVLTMDMASLVSIAFAVSLAIVLIPLSLLLKHRFI